MSARAIRPRVARGLSRSVPVALLRSVIAGTALAAGALGAFGVSPAAAAPPSLAFDTCEAPALDAMRVWRSSSPYTAVAVYIGGEMRACRNAALDEPSWVRRVQADGWGVIPVYVGPQAPCTTYRVRMNGVDPTGHGIQVGGDTIIRARASGLRLGDPVYLDIEPWRRVDPECARQVALFLSSWVQTVRTAGYRTGIYSTPSTGIAVHRAIEAEPGMHAPDLVWVASWNDTPGVPGNDIPAGAWAGRRMHQFRGDHLETWGGVTIEIDTNWVDAPTARHEPDLVVL
jgi:hypothetical protein